MIGALIAKDFSRVRRNPAPYLLMLALPIAVTALIGAAFGPKSSGPKMGRIKVAVVIEGEAGILRNFLAGAADSPEAREYLDLRFPGRGEALAQIEAGEISAVVIVPEGFVGAFLGGSAVPPLELVKNPAQRFYPAIVEEGLGLVTEVLNTTAHTVRPELKHWLEMVEKDGVPDPLAAADLTRRVVERLGRAERYLFPPLAGMSSGETVDAAGAAEVGKGGAGDPAGPGEKGAAKAAPGAEIFVFVLPGMAAMFLFYLADLGARDIYREGRLGTFQRVRTYRADTAVFVASKALFALVVVLAGGAVMFIGAAQIFGITWKEPFALAVLVAGFAVFAVGFITLLAALAGSEKRADMVNNLIILAVAFLGGGVFPVENLPAAVRDYISPLLPNYWFIGAVHGLEFSFRDEPWQVVAPVLALLGAGLVAAAAWRFNALLRKGVATG